MVKKWVEDAIIKNNNVPNEDIVILEYGLSKMLMFLEDVVCTMILGYLLGIIAESIIFQISFMLLRMCAGGHHAETKEKCKIYSALVTTASLFFIKLFPNGICMPLIFTVLASIVIAVLAPVEAIKKPLSDVERKIYHTRTIIVVAVAGLVLACDLMSGNYVFYKPVMVGIYAVCILMVIGDVNNKREG